eukprot:TRINITY_DN20219_c0_g1_i3.p1 TRINITY_DN20219_c0_g1~~TRINITY_DN20219_c0_g1_i3.p1  ORF type:complete len:160 (+),score=22.77 TRINITY_DN20219_c0_g1_i3:242-721(+)
MLHLVGVPKHRIHHFGAAPGREAFRKLRTELRAAFPAALLIPGEATAGSCGRLPTGVEGTDDEFAVAVGNGRVELSDGRAFEGEEIPIQIAGRDVDHTRIRPEAQVVDSTEGAVGRSRAVRSCLLYTSDAADEEDSVDLGGRRIIKKKKKIKERNEKNT